MNPEEVGTVISPDRKKPKKHKTAAAQSIIVSGCVDLGSNVDFMARRTAGVMGNLTRLGSAASSR